jgi:heterodisulfide reductase subunit D
VMQDADAIVKDCADLMARHGLDAETARKVVMQGMLGDQPLPLQGGAVKPMQQDSPS